MFIPVSITLGAGARQHAAYNRQIELAARQMTAFAAHAGNMSEPLTQIGHDLRTQVEMAFGSEGASGATGKWTALSPAYGRWKEQRAPGTPILVGVRPKRKGSRQNPKRPQTYRASGQMRRQLLNPLATHVTPRRMLYAPVSNIAGYHETGTPRMPARPPIDLSLTFLHSIDRTFAVWLATLMREDGV